MADNYLEHRMDDYRRGIGTHAGRPALPRPRTVSFTLPPIPLFVGVMSRQLREAIVRTFASTGMRTTFCDDDASAGTRLAHTTGARLFGAVEVTADTILGALAEAGVIYGASPLLVTDSRDAAIRYSPPLRNTIFIYGDEFIYGDDIIAKKEDAAIKRHRDRFPPPECPRDCISIGYSETASPAAIAKALLLAVCGSAVSGVKMEFPEKKAE